MGSEPDSQELSPLKERLHEIIFEADTPLGKAFDVLLLFAILASVGVVLLESVEVIRVEYGGLIRGLEWFFTILFTLEYILRIYVVRNAWRYIGSFYGVIDLLAIVPTYLSFMLVGAHSLVTIRALRLLRVFRVLKLGHHLMEAQQLMSALRASARKITVFVGFVLALVVIMGSFMYLIEGEEHGFTSIPKSIYWAIVTLTTVGYGDIAPGTILGQSVASVVMIMGYGIIAVPTGIVSVELARATDKPVTTRACKSCSLEGHDEDAVHCKHCGEAL